MMCRPWVHRVIQSVDHPEEPGLLFEGNIQEEVCRTTGRTFELARAAAKFLLQV